MEFTLPDDHPALAGHFPDRPIVPAVVILDEVLALLPRFDPARRASGIVSAKFTAVLLPGQPCRVAFAPRDDGSLRFTCESSGQRIASGILELFPL